MFSSGPTNGYGAASMEPTVTSITATNFVTSGQITAEYIDATVDINAPLVGGGHLAATIDVSAPVGNITTLNCTGVNATGGVGCGSLTATGLLTGTAGVAVGTLTTASPPLNPCLNLYHSSTDHPLASYLIYAGTVTGKQSEGSIKPRRQK